MISRQEFSKETGLQAEHFSNGKFKGYRSSYTKWLEEKRDGELKMIKKLNKEFEEMDKEQLIRLLSMLFSEINQIADKIEKEVG